MTNKQAQITINAIKFMLDHAQYSDDVEEALNMAINALTAQPSSSCVHENDSISRRAAIDAYGDWYVEEGTEDGFIGTVKQLLECLPSAQPDLSSYSDKLWRNAYERGRKEAMEEIIRCKDCKWGDWYTSVDRKRYCYCMETGNGGRTEDDFCSYAERRTDGGRD